MGKFWCFYKILYWEEGLAVGGQDEYLLNPSYVPPPSSVALLLLQFVSILLKSVRYIASLLWERLDTLAKVIQLELVQGVVLESKSMDGSFQEPNSTEMRPSPAQQC